MPLEEDIRKLISEQLGVKEEEIQNSKSIVKDLGADSLDMVEFVMKAEEKFGIEIPDEEAEKLTKVGEIIDYIKNKKTGS